MHERFSSDKPDSEHCSFEQSLVFESPRQYIWNLNNAVKGFWSMQCCLISQFFTHNTYKLIYRQSFNPNMQADLPWQTSTDECKPIWQTTLKRNAKSKCQIQMPNWIALPNQIAELSNWIHFAKLNYQTELPNRIAKRNCRLELPNRTANRIAEPNWITKLNCQTELPNQIAKPKYHTKSPNKIAKQNCHTELQTELPNSIAELHCRTKFPKCITKLNCQTELLTWITKTELPNQIVKPNYQTELPKWIAKVNCRHCQIAKGNRICPTIFPLQNRIAKLSWNTKSLNLLLTLPKWIYPFLASIFCAL
jgi:hypothetical protein